MLSTLPQRGFTIIELLVGITLLAVLIGLGAPAMSTYLQNSKLASAASSYYTGLQMARAEAIRRNVRTEFVLTDDPVSQADLANTLTPAVAGSNWVIRSASGPAAFASAVEAKAGAECEGSSAAAALVVTGSASAPAVFDGRIPFNGFGGTADGASYAISITNPAIGTCVAVGGKVRCRRIAISPGGQIVSCDPAAPAGDSRACP
ncbi:MAG: pilus assembly FimT family protein [Caldimonas sp.]